MTRKTQERVRKATTTEPATATEPSAPASSGQPPLLILHLKIRTKDLEEEAHGDLMMQDQLLVYKPTFEEPEAYDPHPFGFLVTEEVKNGASGAEGLNSAGPGFEEKWHKDTHMNPTYDGRGACWWCCHGMEGEVVTIPMEGSNPSVGYGMFCSFPCACAFLFGQEEMSFRRWERYSLLCSEYRKSGGKFHRVPQAPPRQLLKMFGGTLNIEEFRKLTQRECTYRMVTPTLVHVQPTVSVVPLNQVQVGIGASGAHESKSSVIRGEDGSQSGPLRLKRSKPILEGKNTLENYILGQKSKAMA